MRAMVVRTAGWNMERIALPVMALLGCSLCVAQDFGRVLSSTPLVQQVQVPRQVCTQESWQAPAQKSGAGAAIGAIAGGALGNSIGHGGGRAAATAIGIFGGAVLGDSIEGPGVAQTQNIQRCTTQAVLENRVAAYQVVYEYAGKQYSVQMPQDPGPQVQLQVTPVGVAPPPVPAAVVGVYATPAPPVVLAPPAYISSTTQWYPAYPAYPAYYPYRYRPPVDIQLQFGHGGRPQGHWRHGPPR
jgi:uncharacterized protein YcfJ